MNANVHVPASYLKSEPGLRRGIQPVRHYVPLLVSESGDDHEMGQDFGESLTRAGDRVAGFFFGAGVFAVLWAVCLLI